MIVGKISSNPLIQRKTYILFVLLFSRTGSRQACSFEGFFIVPPAVRIRTRFQSLLLAREFIFATSVLPSLAASETVPMTHRNHLPPRRLKREAF